MLPKNREEIIEAYRSGDLFAGIFNRFENADDATQDWIVATCVDLHNSKEIDLFSIPRAVQFVSLGAQTFFVGQHFFLQTIPKLVCSSAEMMEFIAALIKKGGADLAANQPNTKFVEWCVANPSQAMEIVQAAKSGDKQSINFLELALAAGQLATTAIEIANGYSGERRLAALGAMGRMKNLIAPAAKKLIATISATLETEDDDALRAVSLGAALNIVEVNPSITCDDAMEVIKKACATPGAHLNFSAARGLFSNHKMLNKEAIDHLLRALKYVDPAHNGTIDSLDIGLSLLLQSPFFDEAVSFLEELISGSENKIRLSQFKNFCDQIMVGNSAQLHQIIVSWLLGGHMSVCEGLSAELRKPEIRQEPLHIDIKSFNLTPEQQVFLGRKAIGYFFLQPIIASSIIVSIFRQKNKQVVKKLSELLYNPLLVNYGGDVLTYLKTIKRGDAAFLEVRKVLARGEKYLEQIRSAGPIKELHPSANERQAERMRFNDKMQSAHKEAQKNSVILNLFRRSTILYGKRSVTYVDGPQNQRRPVEMELQEYSAFMEFPRVDIYDPFGLDYTLRRFRVEQMGP